MNNNTKNEFNYQEELDKFDKMLENMSKDEFIDMLNKAGYIKDDMEKNMSKYNLGYEDLEFGKIYESKGNGNMKVRVKDNVIGTFQYFNNENEWEDIILCKVMIREKFREVINIKIPDEFKQLINLLPDDFGNGWITKDKNGAVYLFTRKPQHNSHGYFNGYFNRGGSYIYMKDSDIDFSFIDAISCHKISDLLEEVL